ncbi:MAG: bifunctional riboflavin kinase/FAD synthetase [Acidimicrobiales bacterium]
MEVIRDPSPANRPMGGSVVTIGAYDGVHLGHQWVMAEVIRRAQQQGVTSAVVTFDRHPASVVRPDSAPRLLCDLDQKLELLAQTGVDRAAVIVFDQARANEAAQDFVTEVLVGAMGARVVVVGEDFHFGRGRAGNVALLREMGAGLGFEVEGLGLRTIDAISGPGANSALPPPGRRPGLGQDGPIANEVVSSTRIRGLVESGDVAGAGRLLGHNLQLRGTVVHGDARGGAELGFPTANLAMPAEILLPGVGIYAGFHIRPDGEAHPAAISVGLRPTFYDSAPTLLVESHLLGFAGDLYGEEARLDFVARLRDEQRFSSVDELVVQMGRDVDQARKILAGPGVS